MSDSKFKIFFDTYKANTKNPASPSLPVENIVMCAWSCTQIKWVVTRWILKIKKSCTFTSIDKLGQFGAYNLERGDKLSCDFS